LLPRLDHAPFASGWSTVLFTKHHSDHALAIAGEVLLMLGEKKYACDEASHVLTEKTPHTIYGVDL
jgi:ABC-type cobalamin/Fe3+-siderophores transport system ATPase subunit